MAQKIAIALVHGMGNQKINFADDFIKKLREVFFQKAEKAGIELETDPLVIEPIYWAPILQQLEEKLWHKMDKYGLSWNLLRRFVVSYLGDTVAYNATSVERDKLEEIIYQDVHEEFRQTLRNLSLSAGNDAPLCVVAHSLGTIIASNLVYDLQSENPFTTIEKESSPLEKGETLAWFYTTGSPIALWSLRYTNFGLPIEIPSPNLKEHHPFISGGWLNFYNKNDVLAYPLKGLNEKYNEKVAEDINVHDGNPLYRITPLSHNYYWKSKKVIHTIADQLFTAWLQLYETDES